MRGVINVRDIAFAGGAKGDGVVDDAPAFNAAWAAAKAGGGKVFVPPADPGQFYRCGPINATLTNGVLMEGCGAASEIRPDTTGTWLDMTGSERIAIRDIAVKQYGAVVPNVLMMHAASTAQALAPLFGLDIHNVDIDAKSKYGHLFSYGTRNTTIRHSSFTQRYAGPANSNLSMLTPVAAFDGLNVHGLTSAFATISAGPQPPEVVRLDDVNFVDRGALFPNHSSNSVLLLNNCTKVSSHGGSFRGTHRGIVIWSACEAVNFICPELNGPDSQVDETNGSFVAIGGAFNGNISLIEPWFGALSNEAVGLIEAGPPVGDMTQLGWVERLYVRNPLVGWNPHSKPMIGLGFNPASYSKVEPSWIRDSDVDAYGWDVYAHGSIIRTTISGLVRDARSGPPAVWDTATVHVPAGSKPGTRVGYSANTISRRDGTKTQWGSYGTINPGQTVSIYFPEPFDLVCDDAYASPFSYSDATLPNPLSSTRYLDHMDVTNNHPTKQVNVVDWFANGH